jgi:hypothetical protein
MINFIIENLRAVGSNSLAQIFTKENQGFVPLLPTGCFRLGLHLNVILVEQ